MAALGRMNTRLLTLGRPLMIVTTLRLNAWRFTCRKRGARGAVKLLAVCLCAGAAFLARSAEAGPIFVNLSQFGVNRAPIVSGDGSTVVSTVPYGNGQSEAAIWKWGSQAKPLGVLPGQNSSVPTGVSANGSVVVGDRK